MPRQLNIGGRRGPGGPGQHFGASAKMPEGGMKMVKRLFGYVTRNYKLSLGVVALCIIITSVTTLVSTLFTRTLIDDYIVPLTQSANPDFTPLARTLFTLASVLVVGIICFIFNRQKENQPWQHRVLTTFMFLIILSSRSDVALPAASLSIEVSEEYTII